MKTRLAILLWSVDLARPDACATPFFHAALAAAMDAEVEVHFSSHSVELLVPGVAQGLMVAGTPPRTVYSFMQEAAGHGARFLACTQASAAFTPGRTDWIAELSGHAGAAAFVARALDPDWAVLTY